MSRRQLSLSIITAMGIITAVLVYLIQAVPEPAEPESKAIPVPVEVSIVEPRLFTHYIEALGSVAAVREAEVSSQISGPVSRIPREVELGAAVEQGALLAEIDPVPFRIEVQYREALVARAKAGARVKQVEIDRQRRLVPINRAKLRLARAEHQRLQDLLDRGLVAPQDVERAELAARRIEEEAERAESALQEAELQLAMAEADLASADAELARAKKSLADTRVRAPFSGVISQKQATLGEQVEPGKVLFKLAEISQVKLLVRIPPEDIEFVRTGMGAEITAEGSPTHFRGRVAHIGPGADLETRTFPVEVLVNNQAAARLLPGMFARASVPARTYPNAILVPRSSVFTVSGTPAVFVVNADRGVAERTPVTIGRTFGARYLITRGLKPGDHLVVSGQAVLQHNTPVRVVGTTDSAL